MSRTFLIQGDAGTGKTTFAISDATEANPANYFEFDANSLGRASAGINITEANLVFRSYYAPLTSLMGPGRLSVGAQGGISPAAVHKLEGWSEMLWQFVADYLESLKGPGYPVIDTETKLWLMIRQGFLQEVQQATGAEKDRLGTLQYTEPNARHSQIIEAAKARGKNLVMIAHEKEVWFNEKPTGVMTLDGFKEVPNMVDCSLRFTVEAKKPVATIIKAGTGGLELVGMKIVEPTLAKVNELLDAATALRRNGVPLDGMDVEAIVATAGMMG